MNHNNKSNKNCKNDKDSKCVSAFILLYRILRIYVAFSFSVSSFTWKVPSDDFMLETKKMSTGINAHVSNPTVSESTAMKVEPACSTVVV